MKIFILESLRKDDPKTGQLIHQFLDKNGFENEFFNFHSKQELFDSFDKIKVKCSAGSFQPFVHFDCHGNDEGIGVVIDDNNEELITWTEIHAAFRDIYISSHRKSVICMSSCEGFNAVKLVARKEPCPYDFVCGSFEKISFADGYVGFQKFYQLVLSGKTVYDAALDVHNDVDLVKLKFIGLNSVTLFNLAIDGYLRKECTPEKLVQKKAYYKIIIEQDAPINQIQMDYLNKAFTIEGQRQILLEFANVFFS